MGRSGLRHTCFGVQNTWTWTWTTAPQVNKSITLSELQSLEFSFLTYKPGMIMTTLQIEVTHVGVPSAVQCTHVMSTQYIMLFLVITKKIRGFDRSERMTGKHPVQCTAPGVLVAFARLCWTQSCWRQRLIGLLHSHHLESRGEGCLCPRLSFA